MFNLTRTWFRPGSSEAARETLLEGLKAHVTRSLCGPTRHASATLNARPGGRNEALRSSWGDLEQVNTLKAKAGGARRRLWRAHGRPAHMRRTGQESRRDESAASA